MYPQRKLDEDILRRELTSAAQLIDPRPPTRDELNVLHRRPRRGHRALRMSPRCSSLLQSRRSRSQPPPRRCSTGPNHDRRPRSRAQPHRGGEPVLSEAVKHSLCSFTQWQPISPNAISFTCAPVSGMQPHGVLIVEPHYGGTKQVIVTLPADEQTTATDILDSFH